MRDHYESWWAGVEPNLKDFLPISIGSAVENPVELCSSDWEEVYADNPGHVSDAVGGPRGGPWNILVERDGEYEIALSRWPPHMKLPLASGRAPQKMTAGSLPPGKAVPIAGAKLSVGGQEYSAKASPQDTSVVFKVQLKKGPKSKLHGWFQDAGGTDVCGAFYATVRRM
jgi:hypothetical protein